MRGGNRYGRRLLLITAAVCTRLTIFGAVFPRASVFEVEKKYDTPADLFDIVNRSGGQFTEHEHFKDTYLDTPDALLGRNDVWLRRRNDTLQLKIPFHTGGGGGRGKTWFFRAEDDATNISKELQNYMPSFRPAELNTTAEALYEALLQELVVIAEFSTDRTKYKVDDLNIVSDLATFGGYTVRVTEIKSFIENDDHDENDNRHITLHYRIFHTGVEVWHMKPLGPKNAGKLDVFLRTQNPQYRQHLVEAG
eukprot:3612641-Amphidinium_carterae.1